MDVSLKTMVEHDLKRMLLDNLLFLSWKYKYLIAVYFLRTIIYAVLFRQYFYIKSDFPIKK